MDEACFVGLQRMNRCDSNNCRQCHATSCITTSPEQRRRAHTSPVRCISALEVHRLGRKRLNSKRAEGVEVESEEFDTRRQHAYTQSSGTLVVVEHPRDRGSLLPVPWRYRSSFYGIPHHETPPAVFHLLQTMRPSRRSPGGDVITGMAFNASLGMLAAGLVTKELRIYDVDQPAVVWRDDGASCTPRKVHVGGRRARGHLAGTAARSCSGGSGGHTTRSHRVLLTRLMPGKVSCVAWDPFLLSEGVLTVGDYDGVLHQVDVGSGHHLAEVEAHSGRRVCSVHHSTVRRALAVSTSDDRTARLWGGSGLREAVATITPPGPCPLPVCCAHFSSEDEHLLAVASSDRCVYLYDVRSTHAPIEVLRHHSAPVSYVAFLGGRRLVTASTDATVAVWDLHGSGGAGGGREGGVSSDDAHGSSRAPTRVCTGHRNSRNFVGLSVRPDDGLVAVGSESGHVHAYYPSWGPPLASAHVCTLSSSTNSPALSGSGGAAASGGGSGSGGEFVSSVCWLQPADGGGPPLLAAGTSSGCVSLLALTEA